MIARLSQQLSADYCVWHVTLGLLISGLLVN